MRILQIIYESFGSPFGFGGAGVRAYEIYRRLKDRHDITLLCMKYPGARNCMIDGLKHVFVGTESESLTKSVLAYTLKAAQFVKKYGHEFDVIVENFLPSTPFFAKYLTRTPVILQVQGIMERHAFKKFSPLYALPMSTVEEFYPGLYDRFIFVSDITRQKVMKRVKRVVKSCSVIPNGVDERLLEVVPEEGDYILFMSRIDIYTKGLDLLVKAFESISPRYPDLRLVLAGYEFDTVDSLLAHVPSSIRKKIHYAGFVTGEDKIQLLSKAKLVVLPSRHESAPISILEAAACGKPVVVSDIPELRFVLSQGFGYSFRFGSYERLADCLMILLERGDLRRTLGEQGRKYIAQYPWNYAAQGLERMLREK